MSESVNGEAVSKISELARNAAGAEIMEVSINAPGLPSSFPVLFDKRRDGNGLVELSGYAETWRTAPERRKGTANVTTLQSFIDLTNRHKDGNSVIFAKTQWPGPSLTAVLDYHERQQGAPRFGTHRVHYAFPITDEFKAWAGQDEEGMSQEEFAFFIEEHLSELTDPADEERKEFEALFMTKIATPSEMLTLSRGLQINVSGRVANAQVLQSGERHLTFSEEHQDEAGKKLIVPGLFMIAMPAFIDGDPVRIPVRLRYRVKGGSINWFFQMYRWQQLLHDRAVDDLEKAKTATELPAYEGSQES